MMSAPTQHEVTRLLQDWQGGDPTALDRLTPLVYEELRRLAHNYMSRQRPGHTLQTTALVNEAFLRLVDQQGVEWQGKAHFIAVAARAMRHIVVDHARQKQSAKRGGTAHRVALDEALQGLAELHPRRSRVVELRHFGGLNNREAAEVLGVSEATVERDWRFARAWLYRELERR